MKIATCAGAVACALSLAGAASASAAEYVPGQVVVKYAEGASASGKSAAADRAGVTGLLSGVLGTGAQVLRVTGSVERAVATLNRSSTVLYAEPNYVYRALATPNDPQWAQQDDLNNTGQRGGTADADIDAPEGWDAGSLGAFPATGGAKVGIVDSGIDQDHPDLAGQTVNCAGVTSFGLLGIIGANPAIANGRCEDDNGHGTHVAGTVAAKTNNGVGIAGIAFTSPLAICKGLSSSGSGSLQMVANCVTYLNQQGAKVISMSLGSTSGAATLQTAIQNATNNGSLVIAASGNGGNSTVNYPAGYPEVVSVGATDNRDAIADFSTFNADVEISAPGVETLSTTMGGGYGRLSGTSMATPHVAGVAGLIASKNPGLSVAQLRAKLVASVDDLGPAGRDAQFGFGRVNLAKALG